MLPLRRPSLTVRVVREDRRRRVFIVIVVVVIIITSINIVIFVSLILIHDLLRQDCHSLLTSKSLDGGTLNVESMLEKCNWVSCACSKVDQGTRPLSELVRFTSEENLKNWVSWIWRAREVGLGTRPLSGAPSAPIRHTDPPYIARPRHSAITSDMFQSRYSGTGFHQICILFRNHFI